MRLNFARNLYHVYKKLIDSIDLPVAKIDTISLVLVSPSQEMALKVLSAVKHRHFMKQLTNVSITRTFETSAVNAARVRKNWKYLSQDNTIRNRFINGLQRQPDIWFQITVPNEFQPVGEFNIGVSAGIETTV